MKKKKKIIVCFIINILGAVDLAAQEDNVQVDFLDYTKISWTEVLDKARQKNKPIFVDAWTPWCGPCKTLKSKVFTHSEVVEVLNDNFICVDFDAEHPDWYNLGFVLHATSYPTVVFLTPDGEIIHKAANLQIPINDENGVSLGIPNLLGRVSTI